MTLESSADDNVFPLLLQVKEEMRNLKYIADI
jgi:hypothetical protein